MNALAGLALIALAMGAPARSQNLPFERGRYRPPPSEDVFETNPYGPPAGGEFHNPYLRRPVPFGEELTIEKLFDVIRTKHLTTIESVIAELPANMKEDNYALVYRSRSLQRSTPRAPRAIVYTPTASFVLAFGGGDPNLAGHDTIETFQFRSKTQTFEFRELTFDGKDEPRIGPVNPRKCLMCHQSPARRDVDPRPNWEPYATWLGVYGSDDGDFPFRSLRDQLNGVERPEDGPFLDEQAREADLFRDYIENVAPTHPRYALLGHFNVHAPVDLSEHLALLNFQRVARLADREAGRTPLGRDVLAAWVRCGFTALKAREHPGLAWLLKFEQPRDRAPTGSLRLDSLSDALATFNEPFGVDTSDWSMDFATGGRLAFIERLGTPAEPKTLFAWAWDRAIADAASFPRKGCTDWMAKALRRLDAAAANGDLDRVRSRTR